ncbi:MAG: hypothetical protein JW768_16645 [Chitinispirillaceae bacterium]|nr:hypothetical protein [Chitinispirillaceae bacterium]
MKTHPARLFYVVVVPLLFIILAPSDVCRAESANKTAAIEKQLSSAETLIAEGSLQEAHEAIDRAKLLMNELSGPQSAPYNALIRKLLASISAVEDSLVKINIEILRKHGGDSAFQYMQDVVWAYGISKEKLEKIESTILEEASTVNVEQERDDVAYALSLLESNKPMDSSIDPYIVKTAQMLMQARADSIKRATEAKKPASEAKEVPAPEKDAGTAKEAKEPAKGKEPPEKVAVMSEKKEDKPLVAPEKKEQDVAPSKQPEERVAKKQVAEPDKKPKPKAIVPEPRKSTKTVTKKKPEEYTSPALLARAEATRNYLKKLKENQKSAQRTVVVLYEMIEKGEGQKAMAMFRGKRAFLGKHISPQVFNVLELTLAQTIIDAKKGKSGLSRMPSSPASPEQTSIDRIEALMRQNRVEAAYREFTRSEESLKNYMKKKDFKLFKDMIESAYELRTGVTIDKKKKK